MEKKLKNIEVKDEKVLKTKKQKKSTSYAIKAVDKHIETIGDGGYLTEGEIQSIQKTLKLAKERYIKEEYGF